MHVQGCMAAVGWRVVIADESHTLRTSNRAPDARHTEAVVSVVKRAAHAIFLSGTPSLSRPFDLFRQVSSAYGSFRLHCLGQQLITLVDLLSLSRLWHACYPAESSLKSVLRLPMSSLGSMYKQAWSARLLLY